MIETPNRPMDLWSLEFRPTSKSRVRHETLSMQAARSSLPVVLFVCGHRSDIKRMHLLFEVLLSWVSQGGRSFFSFLFPTSSQLLRFRALVPHSRQHPGCLTTHEKRTLEDRDVRCSRSDVVPVSHVAFHHECILLPQRRVRRGFIRRHGASAAAETC